MRTTYTVATMDVPDGVYAAVRERLVAAGYEHAIHAAGDDEPEMLDMTGVALQAEAAPLEAFAKSCLLFPHRACPGGCESAHSGGSGHCAQCLRQPAVLSVDAAGPEDMARFRALWDGAMAATGALVPVVAEAADSVAPALHTTAALDAVYAERNLLVALLARLFRSGTRRTAIEGWDPAWHNCVYIELPNGQASWHYHDRDAHLFASLPPYGRAWDGHTTAEKYQRIEALAKCL